MAILSHILGFPRIGLRRELKNALEKYWKQEISQHELLFVGRELRMRHWCQQRDSGIDFISVGDFSWYDHVLTTSLMFGNIPPRFRVICDQKSSNDLDLLFSIARGISEGNGKKMIVASEMKKWFNTNYHYIVPEFIFDQKFKLIWTQLFDEVDEALLLGCKIKVVLLGPISYLWLGKMKCTSHSKLSLLPSLLLVYRKILKILSEKGIDWVQIDEPILVLELPIEWREVYSCVYDQLNGFVKLLLTTYFDSVSHQIEYIKRIPVDGLHVDLIFGDDDLDFLHDQLPKNWILSVGVVNGRNIWRTDLQFWFNKLLPLIKKRTIWIGSSCSLIHVPIDLNTEVLLEKKLKKRLSFALQKCKELKELCVFLSEERAPDDLFFNETCNDENITIDAYMRKNAINSFSRLDYRQRLEFQKNRFGLPICPVTTIGSFPQTSNIRRARLDFKFGRLDQESYEIVMKQYIKDVIVEQERLGLDVLVHGEPERNDMVEYFGENLQGFIVTQNGWVQSYGSRCVKPPIIFDTVIRSRSITVKWIAYAQSLTDKPVKGMLTGPLTILCWSFPREDITREALVLQIALAIRDEVSDLERNGIGIIQIDEPALREGLPLKFSSWKNYLRWAVTSFKLITSVVGNDVQIHTHMCYSEFSDIIESIIDMDADVLSIESSRLDMLSLDILKKFRCNAIGPGIYDIHSPYIPSKDDILNRLIEIIQYIDVGRLWINPDCGLKTRSWNEIRSSLFNIVVATKEFRKRFF